MKLRKPVAFFSYVRSDDQHDFGKISGFRERLEGEIRMQTGQVFEIFQDRNDIRWGDEWAARLDSAISDATFLIPIVSPSYFESRACKDEFEKFLNREKTLGSSNLIFPVYYVTCDKIDDEDDSQDEIVRVIKSRNWLDWRPFRHLDFRDADVAQALAQFAKPSALPSGLARCRGRG